MASPPRNPHVYVPAPTQVRAGLVGVGPVERKRRLQARRDASRSVGTTVTVAVPTVTVEAPQPEVEAFYEHTGGGWFVGVDSDGEPFKVKGKAEAVKLVG